MNIIINGKINDRIEYMRIRFKQLEEIPCDVVLPITSNEVKEEVSKLDTFGEYQREKQREKLLSDEG